MHAHLLSCSSASTTPSTARDSSDALDAPPQRDATEESVMRLHPCTEAHTRAATYTAYW